MSLQIWLPFHGDNSQIGPNGGNINIRPNVNFNYADSTFGSCTYFNGSAYVLSSTGPLSNNTNDWTYTCWFWTSSKHNGCLFSSRTEVNTTGIAIFYYTDKFLFDDGVRWEFTSSDVPTGAWVHLAFVRRKGVGKFFYVNGILKQSTSTTGTPTTVGPRYSIGESQTSQSSASGNPLTAWLYDVRVYDNALTGEEIAAFARKDAYGSDKQSLAVWLPLNGNYSNYGNRNMTPTISNGIATASGKIGPKSYLFNGSSHYLEGTYKATQNISFCLWVYFNSLNSGHLFDARTADGNSGYQPMYITSTSIQIGNTGTSFPTINYSWSTGKWYHICVTHDYNQAKLYVNGSLISTQTGAGGRDLGVCNFDIACRCSHVNFLNVRVNDVRIYNRTLTADEVKNISRGLAVHYRLDHDSRSGNFLTNVFTGSGWSYSSFDANTCVYTRSTTATSESYILAPCSTYVLTGYTYTLSCLAKSNGYVSSMDMYKYNSSTQHIQSSNGISLTTDYKLYQWTFTPTHTENVYFRFDNNGSTSSGTEAILYIKNPTLEVAPLSNLMLNNTATRDSSGMGNHGTVTANIGCSPECSPFYTASSYFAGLSNAIKTLDLSTITSVDGTFTFSVWFKKSEWGGDSWETIFGGPSGFELEGKLSTSTNAYIHPYSWGGGSTSSPNSYSIPYSFNQWHMVTMVRTPSNTKFYLDGQLKVTGSAGSIPSGNYFIGSWRDYDSQNFKGLMSDARIYSTALTDDEVAALYRGII